MSTFIPKLTERIDEAVKEAETGIEGAESGLAGAVRMVAHPDLRKDSTGIHPGPASDYQWNHTYLNPLAMVDKVGEFDLPSVEWMASVAEKLLDLHTNHLELDGSSSELA